MKETDEILEAQYRPLVPTVTGGNDIILTINYVCILVRQCSHHGAFCAEQELTLVSYQVEFSDLERPLVT